MQKVSQVAKDASNACFRIATCSGCYVWNFGHMPAICADASKQQIYEAFTSKFNARHSSSCAVATYFMEELQPDSCITTNVCKAGAMRVGNGGELDAQQENAHLDPREHVLIQYNKFDPAGDHVGTSDSNRWDILSSHDVIGILSQLSDSPSIDDLICILQICKRNKDAEYGKNLHAHVCKFGLEAHKIVGNHVVQMFSDCGCVSMAQQIFSTLMDHNVYTWTALMAGFIQHGQVHKVVTMYEKMQEISLYPSKHMLVTMLKACARLKDVERGRHIYSCIIQRGMETDFFVGSASIDMYAKCGLLLDAEEVFDKLPLQNTVSWSSLIAAYVDHARIEKALQCFEEMQCEGISPDEITFVSILKCCGILKARDKALETHGNVILRGFEKGILVGNNIVDMYAKCGFLVEAGAVCSKLAVRDVVSWTSLITGYSEHGFHMELLVCFDKMQLEGVLPDATAFASVLKACSTIGAIEKGREIHRKAEDRQLDHEMFVCSALVDMYAKCGFVLEAQVAFDKLRIRDAVSWNVLIAGYADHGPCKEVLHCFQRMQSDGVAQSAVTFLCALKACGDAGAIDKGQELHMDATLRAFDNDSSVGSTLVDMYAKVGLLAEACDVFHKLRTRDVVSWNVLIKAHGINQVGSLAIHLFECMQKQGVKPDNVTFTCLLKACSRTCLVPKAQQLFTVMTRDYGVTITRDHMACMVDLFARSGQVDAALKSLETMPSSPSDEMLRVLLSACKTHTGQALGTLCYEQLVQLNAKCAAPYLLMSDIYQRQGKWELAYKLEELRRNARATKKPANAFIEVNKKVHEFLVGEPQGKGLRCFLRAVTSRVVSCGHVPDLEGVLRLIRDGSSMV